MRIFISGVAASRFRHDFVPCGSFVSQTMFVPPRQQVRHRITCLWVFPSQVSGQPSFGVFISTRNIYHEQESGVKVTVQHIFNFVLILWGLTTTSYSG